MASVAYSQGVNPLMRAAIRAALAQDWIVRLAGRKRSSGPDQALDRQVAAVLEYQRLARLPPLETLEPAAARALVAEQLGAADLPNEAMGEILDTTVGEHRIPVRAFVPRDAGPGWIVWFHGGGGVIGSIAEAEPVTRYLAARTRCTVASVGYRLGPEHPHPAALEDARDAWEALVQRVPPGGRVAVGGDSFGGYLAAQVDRFAREAGERRPDLQILVYPILDFTLSRPSVDRLGEGYLLTRSMMQWFRAHYMGDDTDYPAASPWFWDDVSGAAPAIVVTAGYDPLVEEGDAWATRLAEAGVAVRHLQHPSLVHGFMGLAGVVRAGRAAVDQLCAEIVAAMAG